MSENRLHRDRSDSTFKQASPRALASSTRTQDSAYLREASQVQNALTEHLYLTQGNEGTKQFAVGEVIRGKGRAVYSINDHNSVVRELNKIFQVKNQSGFTEDLCTKLKEFQRTMIRKDPRWRDLEAELSGKHKTLADGLVGPLTIKALVNSGYLGFNSKGKLVALKVFNQSLENGAVEIKKEIDKQSDGKGTSDQSEKEKTEKRLEIKDEEPRKSEKPVQPNPLVAGLKKDLEATQDRLSRLQAESGKTANKAEQALDVCKNELQKIRSLDMAFAENRLLTYIPKVTDVLSHTASCQTSLATNQKILEVCCKEQTALQARITQLEGFLLAETGKKDSALQRSECNKAKLELLNINKLLDSFAREQQTNDQGFAHNLRYLKDELDYFNRSVKEEKEAQAQLASAVSDKCTVYAKKHMPFEFDEDSSAHWSNVSTKVFAKTFSKNQTQSLSLYKDCLASKASSFGDRSPLGFGMQFSDNYSRFISNLEKQSVNSSNGLDAAERKQLVAYVAALKHCKEANIGIDNPLRFSAKNLISLVEERLNPKIDKPLMVITAAKSDWNGAFYSLDDVASKFLAKGYRVQYHEIASETDYKEALKRATNNGATQAKALCLSGHGDKTSISLSDDDPRFNNVPYSERTLDLNDKDKLLSTRPYLEDQCCIIINSCSTGQGEKEAGVQINNIANLLRHVYPQAGRGFIFAPVGPANITDIKFDTRGRVVDITQKNRKNQVIKNYQAYNFRKPDDGRLAA